MPGSCLVPLLAFLETFGFYCWLIYLNLETASDQRARRNEIEEEELALNEARQSYKVA